MNGLTFSFTDSKGKEIYLIFLLPNAFPLTISMAVWKQKEQKLEIILALVCPKS